MGVWGWLQVLISRATTSTRILPQVEAAGKEFTPSQRYTDGGIRSFVWNLLEFSLSICLSLFLSPDLWSMWRGMARLVLHWGRLPGASQTGGHRAEQGPWMGKGVSILPCAEYRGGRERMGNKGSTSSFSPVFPLSGSRCHLRAPLGTRQTDTVRAWRCFLCVSSGSCVLLSALGSRSEQGSILQRLGII